MQSCLYLIIFLYFETAKLLFIWSGMPTSWTQSHTTETVWPFWTGYLTMMIRTVVEVLVRNSILASGTLVNYGKKLLEACMQRQVACGEETCLSLSSCQPLKQRLPSRACRRPWRCRTRIRFYLGDRLSRYNKICLTFGASELHIENIFIIKGVSCEKLSRGILVRFQLWGIPAYQVRYSLQMLSDFFWNSGFNFDFPY